MTYGKVEGESLKVAPKQLRVSGKLIASPRGSDYKAAGYLPVDPSGKPPEGYRWNDKWMIEGGKIVKKFDEIPPEEQAEIDGMRMVVMTQEEAEAYENMEQTIADAQTATQEAQAAAEAAQAVAETAQQEAAEAVAAKEAAEAAQATAEAALADVSDVMEKIEEVFG